MLSGGRPVFPSALGQVPLTPLPQVLRKAVLAATRSSCYEWEGVPTCVRGQGHMPPPAGQLCGLPCRVEYLSTEGVLLPPVYGTFSSALWLELRDPAAWQATPSWAVCRHACHRLLPWLRVTFAMVPDAARRGSDQWPWSTAPATGPAGRLGCPSASDPSGVVRCALSFCRPRRVCVCRVRGLLALVHWCTRPVCSVRGVRGHLALDH